MIICFCSAQEYRVLFEESGNNPGDKTLEDKFFEYEVITAYRLKYELLNILADEFPRTVLNGLNLVTRRMAVTAVSRDINHSR